MLGTWGRVPIRTKRWLIEAQKKQNISSIGLTITLIGAHNCLVFKSAPFKVILSHLQPFPRSRLAQIKLRFLPLWGSFFLEPSLWKKQLGEISFKQFGLNQQGRKSSEVSRLSLPKVPLSLVWRKSALKKASAVQKFKKAFAGLALPFWI